MRRVPAHLCGVHGGNGDKFKTTSFVAKSGQTVDDGELQLKFGKN